jgi:hypothetical protein
VASIFEVIQNTIMGPITGDPKQYAVQELGLSRSIRCLMAYL